MLLDITEASQGSTVEQCVQMVSSKKQSFNMANPLHRCLLRGIAVHHAGLPTQYKQWVERLFRMRRLAVIFATGTLAMGINVPAKTVVFAGDALHLNAMLYRQCAGRAGRRGFDLRGQVVFFGIRSSKVKRLLRSKLPTLTGNLLLSSSTSLRLVIRWAKRGTRTTWNLVAIQTISGSQQLHSE